MKTMQQCADKSTAQDSYHSYLVRIWKDGARALWRSSAQSAQTGEIVRFANLAELFTFLEAQTGDCTDEEMRVGWQSHPTHKPNV